MIAGAREATSTDPSTLHNVEVRRMIAGPGSPRRVSTG